MPIAFATQTKLRIVCLYVLRQFHRLLFVSGPMVNVTAITVVLVLTEVCVSILPVCICSVCCCVCFVCESVHVACVCLCYRVVSVDAVCVWWCVLCVVFMCCVCVCVSGKAKWLED